MSIAAFITEGIGPSGSVKYLLTGGLDIGVPPPFIAENLLVAPSSVTALMAQPGTVLLAAPPQTTGLIAPPATVTLPRQ